MVNIKINILRCTVSKISKSVVFLFSYFTTSCCISGKQPPPPTPLPFRRTLYLHNLAKSVNLYGILHLTETLITTFQPALVFTAVSDKCQLGSYFGWNPKIDTTKKIIHKLQPPRNTKHLPEYNTQIFLSNHLKGGGVSPDNYTHSYT